MTALPRFRLDRTRLAAPQVLEKLRDAILSLDLVPGTVLVRQELADRFGVSQTPVREALARLSAEGQLVFVHNVGYRLPDAPSAKQYADWAVSRVIVESNALLYILGPIDPRILDEAEAINEQIRSSDFGTAAAGVRRFSELNWRFHAKLLSLARNEMLEEVHARLYASPQFSRIFLGRGILYQAEVAAEHAQVIERLRKGERQAAADALRDHIVESLERDATLSQVSVSLRRLVRGQPPDAADAQD